MKPTQTPDGFFVVPVAGSRKFRTAAEAQEYCDFIADDDEPDFGCILCVVVLVIVFVGLAAYWALA